MCTAGIYDFDNMLRLWREGFGDDEAFVREYLLVWRPQGRPFVKRVDGRIVSAADVLWFDCNGVPVAYIYGVVTDKRFRGRGLASELVAEILGYVRASGGCVAMLIAADKGLSEWYRWMGFSSRMQKPVSLVSPDGAFDFGTGCPADNLPQFRIADVAGYLALFAARGNAEGFSADVADSVIAENNGVFRVSGGKVLPSGDGTGMKVSVSQLADLFPPCLSDFRFTGLPRSKT